MSFGRIGGLEQYRNTVKPRIVHQPPKSLRPNLPLANILVPINFRAEGLFAIVAVNRVEVLQTHDSIKICPDAVVVVRDVVASGKDMAGIEAYSESRVKFKGVQKPRELLKAVI